MKKILACGMVLFAVGCPSPAKDSQYPPRPEGCDVKVFHETPTMATDNIGPVSSTCDESVEDSDCMRTLMDEVCKLGGDVVWGVEPNPTKELGKKKFFGRAAHTK